LTEAEIIKYCKSGDHKGFKFLIDRYAAKLMGICLRYMQNEFAAKDVLQDCFIRIFENITNYKPTGSFEAWISKIAVTSSLMALRKKKNGFAYLETVQEERTYLPEIDLELNEEDILKMILRLPEHYRIVFNMSIIEGYSHAEIADILEINESTSRTKLTRARKMMQEIYLTTIENKQDFKAIQKLKY
jgi:RNA polymerase sigma-70 factor (ECF subfamily)